MSEVASDRKEDNCAMVLSDQKFLYKNTNLSFLLLINGVMKNDHKVITRCKLV